MGAVHEPAGQPTGGQFAKQIRLESGIILDRGSAPSYSPARMRELQRGIAERQEIRDRLQGEMDAMNLDSVVSCALRDYPAATELRLRHVPDRRTGEPTEVLEATELRDTFDTTLTSGISWKYRRAGHAELPLAAHLHSMSGSFFSQTREGIGYDPNAGEITVDLTRNYSS
ncbi:MAG TPA: hypothetical protein VF867_01300 [Arthrobacter sp.]